jgi:hypothetical protein
MTLAIYVPFEQYERSLYQNFPRASFATLVIVVFLCAMLLVWLAKSRRR